LPTLDKLATRRPDLYKNFKKYVICQVEEENRKHLFQYTGLKNLLDQIKQETIMNFEKEILLILNNKVQDTDQADHSLSKNNNNIAIFSSVPY
jgi:hypothetical protein